MRRLAIGVLAGAIASSAGSAPANRCAEYHKDYKVATARLADALQKYAGCIDNGDPTDACSTQYAHLRSAHRLLEISTYNFSHYCRSSGRSARDGF